MVTHHQLVRTPEKIARYMVSVSAAVQWCPTNYAVKTLRLGSVGHHTCKEEMISSCIAIYNVKFAIKAKKMVPLL